MWTIVICNPVLSTKYTCHRFLTHQNGYWFYIFEHCIDNFIIIHLKYTWVNQTNGLFTYFISIVFYWSFRSYRFNLIFNLQYCSTIFYSLTRDNFINHIMKSLAIFSKLSSTEFFAYQIRNNCFNYITVLCGFQVISYPHLDLSSVL